MEGVCRKNDHLSPLGPCSAKRRARTNFEADIPDSARVLFKFSSRGEVNAGFDTDLLVVGCGMAGSAAALQAARLGMHVTMLSASAQKEDCNSYWAQGGIIYKSEVCVCVCVSICTCVLCQVSLVLLL